MHAFRFGLSLLLCATPALGSSTAYGRDADHAPASGQKRLLTANADRQLAEMLTALIASAEVGADGNVFLNRAMSEGLFLEPYSGRYWQISAVGREDFASRSLWDRRLQVGGRAAAPAFYNSSQFPNEPLRIAQRTVCLPGSDVEWRFVVAQSRDAEQPATEKRAVSRTPD